MKAILSIILISITASVFSNKIVYTCTNGTWHITEVSINEKSLEFDEYEIEDNKAQLIERVTFPCYEELYRFLLASYVINETADGNYNLTINSIMYKEVNIIMVFNILKNYSHDRNSK